MEVRIQLLKGERDRFDFKEEYFSWMTRKINYKNFPVKNYTKLLLYLNSVPFEVKVKMDQNRVSDAYEMREKFKDSDLWMSEEVPFELKNGDGAWPASVLEVLVALASRMEDDLLADSNKGDQTPVWFWDMMTNLGLTKFANETLEKKDSGIYMDSIIRCFNERNGKYIFKKPDDIKEEDWKNKELWDQMNEVLTRKIE